MTRKGPNQALQRTPGFGVQLPSAALVRPAQSRAVLPAMKPGTARAFALRRRAHSRAPGPESLSLCLVRPMRAKNKPKLLLWISRLAAAVSVVALLFVYPLCHCPRYYSALSVAGLVPLLCGPRLYRWFGGAFIVVALAFAAAEHRAARFQAEQIQHIQAEANAQHP
jgi:hypothetical protein